MIKQFDSVIFNFKVIEDKPLRSIVKISGADTETYKGYARIFTFDDNEHHKKIWDITSEEDMYKVFKWLTENKAGRVIYFFNVDYDVRAMLKWLPVEYIQQIAAFNQCEYRDLEFSYMQGKWFTIRDKKRKRIARLFDLWQFYNTSLESAAIRFLDGQEKRKDLLTEANISIENLQEVDFLNPLFRQYAIEDAYVTRLLGERFHNFLKTWDIQTNRPYSKATISGLMLNKWLHGKCNLAPKLVQEAQWYSYHGGRFECFKRGYFKDAYEYDINSAYPKILADLEYPHHIWKRTTDPDWDSSYGFAYIKANINEKIISPFMQLSHTKVNICPNGKFEGWVTYPELELLDSNTYIIIDGYEQKKTGDKPYTPIYDLYKERKELKQLGNPQELIIKIILNAQYGKQMQLTPDYEFIDVWDSERSHEDIYDAFLIKDGKMFLRKVNGYKTGRLYNMAIASYITAKTRVQLWKAAKKNENDIIAFATDAIFSKKKLNLKESSELGDWKLEGQGNLAMVGSGVYQFNDQVKFRGFSRKCNLMEMLENQVLKVSIKRPFKLKEAVKQDRIDEMNVFLPIEKELNINFDKKRVWDRDFIDTHDVLNSQIDSIPLRI